MPKKPLRIITAEQFDAIYEALDDETMQLLVETDIETGLRWGELTELRVKDLDFADRGADRLAGRRRTQPAVPPRGRALPRQGLPEGQGVAPASGSPTTSSTRSRILIAVRKLGPDDLLFELPQRTEPRRRVPSELPDPETLGWTEPNENGRSYRHGTSSAYVAGRCRCRHCKDVMAAYRASRRAAGKDQPRPPRRVDTDGHIGRDWFRRNVWKPAVTAAGIAFKVTPTHCATPTPRGCSPAAPTSRWSRNASATAA